MADAEHVPAWRQPLRGHKKRTLIRELAIGDKTQVELAEKYNVDQSAISAFKRRHAEEIAEVSEDLDNELSGLWIAKKANRLAEYEHMMEMLKEATAQTDDVGFTRLMQTVLRSAAEEMGHLKGTVEVDHKVTHYTVEGIDPKDLT